MTPARPMLSIVGKSLCLINKRMTELQRSQSAQRACGMGQSSKTTMVTKHIPELADPAQAAPLQRATIAMLTDIGLTEPGAARVMERRAEVGFA